MDDKTLFAARTYALQVLKRLGAVHFNPRIRVEKDGTILCGNSAEGIPIDQKKLWFSLPVDVSLEYHRESHQINLKIPTICIRRWEQNNQLTLNRKEQFIATSLNTVKQCALVGMCVTGLVIGCLFVFFDGRNAI